MSDERPLRVAIDVRMPASQWGGVQQLAQGLATGLSQLDVADEFLFLGFPDAAGWLDPLLSGRCRRVEVPLGHGRSVARRAYDAVATRSGKIAGTIGRLAGPLSSIAAPIPRSNGLIESLGVDVVHFVTPQAYLTGVPSIYQPLDLLHVHLPENFSALHRRYRERAYRVFCEQASCVVSMTRWGGTDLARHYGLPSEKIAVVPLPPVVVAPAADANDGHSRPSEGFLLYPAQTWVHKNHIALVDALRLVRDRGLAIPIICTGRKTDHFAAVERHVTASGVDDLITFRGYVDESELRGLYRSATGLIFPSRFEGWGLPVVEAFASSLPVACSDIPVLREVAGDAAQFFDPADPADLADAMIRLWTNDELRTGLRIKGLARVAAMTWPSTAAAYRALYKRTAGHAPSDDDRALLRDLTLVA